MKKSRTTEENVKYWQSQVEAYRKSGLTQREYCRQQEISHWTFNLWKRKIESGSNKLQEIQFSIVHSILSKDKGIDIILGDKIRISISDEFSEAALQKIHHIFGVVR